MVFFFFFFFLRIGITEGFGTLIILYFKKKRVGKTIYSTSEHSDMFAVSQYERLSLPLSFLMATS